MSVRVKMKCVFKETSDLPKGGGHVELSPVPHGSPENEAIYKYTPSGRSRLSRINQAAFDQFEVGKEYYVDISPAEVAEPALAADVHPFT